MLQNLTGLPNIIWNQCSQKFLFNSKDCVIRTYVRDEATAMPSVDPHVWYAEGLRSLCRCLRILHGNVHGKTVVNFGAT